MKTNMKLKTLVINLLMINILGSSLAGCNGVGGSSEASNSSISHDVQSSSYQAEDSQATSSINHTEQLEENNKTSEQANNNSSGDSAHKTDLDEIAPLENMELGWGFDTTTNTPINTSVNQKLLISLDEQVSDSDIISVVNIGTSKYSAYTSYTGDSTLNNKDTKLDISGGIGINYGFYSGSIKAAYASYENIRDARSSVTKKAGIKEE
ncbi:MAG: hypothetical protein K0R94_1475, partial [Burkholderiales bacterium]|nr:hypothetical protein [Burkholderiales bacterium]